MPHSHVRTDCCLEHHFMSTRNIYCHGELLHTIQMASIFSDSKTFVDMKLKSLPNITLENFNQFMDTTSRNPTRDQVIDFVNKTFDPAGSEFENWEPNDWTENAEFFNHVRDVELKEWAKKLNALWKFLGRKIKDDVKNNPDLYSIIYVPNPVIVPGGRFREFYYWDSYWIVRGLLLSEMTETVKGMLQNFLSIVDEYGFIPNGGRIYYSMRSQPPLLIPMIQSYLEKSNDTQFIKDNIHIMEKEFNYWLTNHTVMVKKGDRMFRLVRYFDLSSGPRPESYREDFQSAKIFRTEGEKEAYYSELKAAAESGWDFSSRWFILNATNKGKLTQKYLLKMLSFDILNKYHFYKTLLANALVVLSSTAEGRGDRGSNLGGIPATLEQSGEQWDYPNAWPPLQYIMIYALDASGDDWAKELAYQISEKWVRSNYKTFNETSAMYEKYDATVSGGHGSGGEYNVQLGFGWTNGVIMELLDKYGDRLTAEDRFEDNKPLVASIAVDGSVSTFGQVLTLVLALVVPLVIGCIG
uniref:Trehalase n=1 Tax=Timema shepardi TaxID=629360 RepID=A0A7R9AMN5_TIMSH|nr:unnamed protein product [Timema shepardi]